MTRERRPPLDNLRQQSFREIWEGAAYRQIHLMMHPPSLHAAALTTNAHELARKAEALIPGRNVAVIPNGIDTTVFKPLPRNNALTESLNLINKIPAGEAARVIGFAGELREKKGLRPLLSAYAQITKANPATLLIVGDVRAGEDRRLIDDFRQLHPRTHLIVTGLISPQDLPSYYSVMDVVVQPALRDGLPNALLEAMACGKAVIGSAVGGIPDAITDGANGRLVPAQNAEELANVIVELLEDEAERTQLGTSACQIIRNRFTLQAELEANLTVYRQLGLRI